MTPTGNTILMTGGTAGIGRALAEQMQAGGNTVIIAGRRQAQIDEIVAACPGIVGHVLDVADKDAIVAFARQIVADHPALNVLVNNAGIMVEEHLREDNYLADAEAMVVTNVLGPIRLTSALLQHLMAQPRATVMNVSSGLAFVPTSRAPTYCATKAAIHSYTMSLREQLRTTSVEVIELIPPGVQTDLTPGQSTREGYMPLDDFITETMGLLRQDPTPPEICVQRVLMLRDAGVEGRFDQAYAMLNPH